MQQKVPNLARAPISPKDLAKSPSVGELGLQFRTQEEVGEVSSGLICRCVLKDTEDLVTCRSNASQLLERDTGTGAAAPGVIS